MLRPVAGLGVVAAAGVVFDSTGVLFDLLHPQLICRKMSMNVQRSLPERIRLLLE